VGLVLLLAVCTLLAFAGRGPTYLVGGAAPAHPTVPPDPRIEASFAAHMTTDDVARGVYGLAAEQGAVALTAEQRASIRPLLVEGAALREELGALREARRAARARLVADVELP
jgi:hypothetical protein